MKPEEFGKWLESWVKEREAPRATGEATTIIETIPGASYNLYDDKEWLTISWGLIR